MKPSNRLRSRILPCTLAGVFAAASFGCASDAEPQDTTNRLFEGMEIQQLLEENPDAVFFVDLRLPQTYSFDQTEADIDFSHFIVQCPSMEFPIPMEDFARTLDLPLDDDALTLWNSEFDPRYEVEYRNDTIVYVECDDDGEDCVTHVSKI